MDIPAVLSTHARLARCPLRPSSPTRRRLHAIDSGQLTLPFLDKAQVSTPVALVDHAVGAEVGTRPSVQRSRGRAFSPPVPVIAKADIAERNPPIKTAKRKPPGKANIPPDAKLLVSRKEAAGIVSLSLRSIDGLLASKQLPFRKIGNRTLIPLAALQKFARMDHPERIAC
jgi:hypothetical protein